MDEEMKELNYRLSNVLGRSIDMVSPCQYFLEGSVTVVKKNIEVFELNNPRKFNKIVPSHRYLDRVEISKNITDSELETLRRLMVSEYSNKTDGSITTFITFRLAGSKDYCRMLENGNYEVRLYAEYCLTK